MVNRLQELHWVNRITIFFCMLLGRLIMSADSYVAIPKTLSEKTGVYIATLQEQCRALITQNLQSTQKALQQLSDTQPEKAKLFAVFVNKAVLTRIPMQSRTLYDPTKESVRSIACTPDGTSFVSSSGYKGLYMWDIMSGKCTHEFPGHTSCVSSVAVSPNGKTIASGGWEHVIRLWDIASRTCLHVMQGHTCRINSICYGPDGNSIYSSSHDETIRIWDSQTGLCKQVIPTGSAVYSIACSPDGIILAEGSEDRKIRLRDSMTGACKYTLEGHYNSITSVAFSPDGRMLASGSHDNTVRIWNMITFICEHVFIGHDYWITWVAFNPNCKTVASGSADSTVRLWDIATGTCKQVLHDQELIHSVAFNTDGKIILSGSREGTLRLWITYEDELCAVTDKTEQDFLLAAAQDWLEGKPHAIASDDPIYRRFFTRAVSAQSAETSLFLIEDGKLFSQSYARVSKTKARKRSKAGKK